MKINLFLLSLMLMIFSYSSSIAVEPLQGKTENVEGYIHGMGEGFSFAFDNKGIPGCAYYDMNRHFLRFAVVSGGKWNIEDVAPSGWEKQGVNCSLVFDGGNNPVIAYYSLDKKLMTARKTAKGWETEIVDDTPGSGLYCHLVLLPGGAVGIGYQSGEGTMFARKIPGQWQKEKVDETGEKVKAMIDNSGDITLFYIMEEQGKPILKKAVNRQNKWEKAMIPDSQGCGDFDIHTGKKGEPLIAYIKGKTNRVFRETLPGSGIWKEYEISKETAVHLSVAVNQEGFPHIAFVADNFRDLKIARFNGAEWSVKKVATAREEFKFFNCRLIVDSKNRDMIILYDGDSLTAVLQQDDGWRMGLIDGKPRVGGYTRLILNKEDSPLIAYYDYSAEELRFAEKKSDDRKLAITVIDSLGDVGRDLEIAGNSQGNLFISYYDKMRGDLKIAWRKDDKWFWDRIDYEGDVGINTSLAVDDQGIPYISYLNKNSRHLKFATRRDNKWYRELITKLGEYGGSSVITVDSGGQVRVVFVDGYKEAKVQANESPVKTFVKMATYKGDKKWQIEQILGPYAVNINNSHISACLDKEDKMFISFIDRDGTLRLLDKKRNLWNEEKLDSPCMGETSLAMTPDGKPCILYLKGKTPENAQLSLTRFNGQKWEYYTIPTDDKKIEYLDLAIGSDNKIRIVYGEKAHYTVKYFEEN